MIIDECIEKLKSEHPSYTIEGGDGVSGFWAVASIEREDGTWSFTRGAMTNAESLYHSIAGAITQHILNG